MKYLTEKWYQTMQESDISTLWRADRRAENFSEEWFRAVYQAKEKEWLKLRRELAEMTFDEFFNSVTAGMEELTPEEKEEEMVNLFAPYDNLEELRRNFEESQEPYDEENERKLFRSNWRQAISHLKKVLPPEILDKVADIRVLALDKASPEVKAAVRKIDHKNVMQVERTIRKYEKAMDAAFGDNKPDFLDKLSLHDSVILSYRTVGDDCVFRVQADEDEVRTITLKNVKVQTPTIRPGNGCWLYEEVFPRRRGYEFSILFARPSGQIVTYSAACKDIVIS